ncbi:MAG: hypothetical protein ACLFPU_01265 [Dehalococcoidia bacterium]
MKAWNGEGNFSDLLLAAREVTLSGGELHSIATGTQETAVQSSSGWDWSEQATTMSFWTAVNCMG